MKRLILVAALFTLVTLTGLSTLSFAADYTCCPQGVTSSGLTQQDLTP